jgi:prolyl-tRNA editing enzyme YbaK/EbsC (Cys-tRNA(Pro) deacylase)
MEDKKEEWAEPAEVPVSFEKIKAFLEQNKVKFDLTTHEPVRTSEEAAKVRGVDLASGAKAMILKDTGKKLAMEGVPFYLAVLSASNRFSSKAFKKMINCKSLRFATPQECF